MAMANFAVISTCIDNDNQHSTVLRGTTPENSNSTVAYNLADAVPHSGELVVINVSGKRFETFRETLNQFPDTLLGDPFRMAKYYNSVTREYFFDRNQISFSAILHYYQSGGVVYVPSSVPREIHFNEMEFFNIQYRTQATEDHVRHSSSSSFRNTTSKLQAFRWRLWEFLELPESSIHARIWALIDVIIILLSILIVILESMPELKSESNLDTFSVIDTICVAFFTFDFCIRIIICPSTWTFVKKPLNILDFLAIMPFYMELAVGKLVKGSALTTFKVLRIFRIMRVMKLIRHSKRLILMGKVIKDCLSELTLLLIIWLMGVLTFGTIMYYIESEQDNGFNSILHSCWWAVVSISTVGYGDMYPKTGLGKSVGSCLLFISMVYLALPMTVIVSKFNKAFERFRDEDLPTMSLGPVSPSDPYVVREHVRKQSKVNDIDGH